MTTFSSPTFRAAAYLTARPTPPQHWYDLTHAYHRSRGGQFRRALDLGCGPGQIATRLTETFPSVIGVDPGGKMVETAKATAVKDGFPEDKLNYKQGSGEDLSFLEPGSIDLVVASQAAHWFSFPSIYPSLSRILSPKGTVAFWGYGEMTLPSFPSLQPLISTYQAGPAHLGPHWQQPGRSIVEGLLGSIPFPITPSAAAPLPGIDVLGHEKWTPEGGEPPAEEEVGEEQGWAREASVRITEGREMGIEREWTWEQVEGYLASASAWHEYCRVNGEEKGRELNRVYLHGLRKGVEKENGVREGKVKVRWPGVVMLMAKK